MSPSSLTAPSSLCASLLPPSSSYLMNFARLISSSLDNVPPSVPLALAFGAFADPVGFAGAAVVSPASGVSRAYAGGGGAMKGPGPGPGPG